MALSENFGQDDSRQKDHQDDCIWGVYKQEYYSWVDCGQFSVREMLVEKMNVDKMTIDEMIYILGKDGFSWDCFGQYVSRRKDHTQDDCIWNVNKQEYYSWVDCGQYVCKGDACRQNDYRRNDLQPTLKFVTWISFISFRCSAFLAS